MFTHVQAIAAVERAQEVERLMNIRVIAAKLHAAVFVGAGADQHIVITLLTEFFDGEMRVAAVDNVDAVINNELNILLDKFSGNAEMRNDIFTTPPALASRSKSVTGWPARARK